MPGAGKIEYDHICEAAFAGIKPRNGSWTGVSARDTVPVGDISVRFSDALARRDDDAGLILLGEATPPESLKNVQSHP